MTIIYPVLTLNSSANALEATSTQLSIRLPTFLTPLPFQMPLIHTYIHTYLHTYTYIHTYYYLDNMVQQIETMGQGFSHGEAGIGTRLLLG